MAFCLMAFFVIPLILEAPTVLKVWLGIVPDYAIIFMRLVLLISLVNSFSSLLATAKGATGDIKSYQITLTLIGALHIPFVWIAFKLGGGAEYSMYVYLALVIIIQGIRIWFVCRSIRMNIYWFAKEVIFRCSLVFVISSIVPIYLHVNLSPSFFTSLIISGVSCLGVIIATFYIAFISKEREALMKLIQSKIKNK